jgi:hypothetical protein
LADVILLILLVFHITFMALWIGTAALVSSILIPSLGKISAGSRTEFLIAVLPRLLRFVVAASTGAILAGILLFGYETRVATAYAPSSLGTSFIEAGALVGLISYALAIGVALPTASRLVKALKSSKDSDKTGGNMPADIPRLQMRMRMISGAVSGLLALTLILMVIGATV